MEYDPATAGHRIARNTAIQLFGRVVYLALSLINFRLIAEYLGPTVFGDYGNVFNYIALFTVLTDFGLFIVAVREVSQAPERRQEVMENVLSLRLILSVGAALLAFLVAWVIGRLNPGSGYHAILPAIGVASFSMFIYFMSNMLDVVYHVEMKMKYVAFVELLNKIASVAFAWYGVKHHWAFLLIVVADPVGNITGLIARVVTARKFFTLRLRYKPEVWRWLLSMAIPLGIVFTLNQLYFKIDGVMLYLMAGRYDNGLYTAAYRVLETTLFVSAFFVQAMTPYLSNYLVTKKAKARQMITTGSEVMLAVGGVFSLAVVFFSPQIIAMLSGPEYSLAAYPLMFLGATIVVLYLNSLMGQILVLMDARRILLYMAVAILIFNVGLNYLLIPHFTYLGTAVATLVSELLLLGTNVLILRHRHLLAWRPRHLTWIVGGLAIAGAALAYTSQTDFPWIVSFVGIPAIYFLILWRQNIIPLNTLRRTV